MNHARDPLSAVLLIIGGGFLLLCLVIGAIISSCTPRGRCRNSVRRLSWLHMDDTACPHPSHELTLERVGLTAVMRCTCKDGRP